MPLQKHLVVHLQEMFADEMSYQSVLKDWVGQVNDQQLKSAVNDQISGIDQELANLRNCFNLLNASPQEWTDSPFIQAIQQENKMTMQAMPDMTAADMDVHVCMADIGFGQKEIGGYQGMIAMAQALGNQDVVNCLQQNLSHEQSDLQKMQQLLPTLINESQQWQQAA